MKPLHSNLKLKPEDGCTKTSSSCVIWQGPDIPCIDLCKGDTITEVIYDLATKLCEMTSGVIDVTTLDFKCILGTGVAEPTTILGALQAMIDKQCQIASTCCNEGTGGGGSTPTPISLPSCLYFTENGDQVTSLLPNAYSAYLATKICENIASIASLNTSVGALGGRIAALEANSGNGGGTGTTISVVSQCASSSVPGTTVPVSTAFSALESKFCQLTSLLGTSAALSTTIGTECAGLDASAQLSDPDFTMSQLPGWVANPTTLSETIQNIWLTICDMRSAIVNASNVTLPCIPVPVSNVAVTNLTSSGSTVTWSAPSGVSLSESPLQYSIKAYEWNGSAIVGSPVVSATVPYGTNSYNITALADPTKNYQVQIIAEYSCDDSTIATFVGKLALTAVIYCVSQTDVAYDELTQVCDGDSYTTKRRKTVLELKDLSTGNLIGNAYAPFTVQLNYDVDGDCASNTTETITKTFGTGISTVEHIYETERYVKCGSDPCTVKVKTYNCMGAISSERATACIGEVTC
jgi:hypothetical protein